MLPSNRPRRGAQSTLRVPCAPVRSRTLYPEGVVPGRLTRYENILNHFILQKNLEAAHLPQFWPTQDHLRIERPWDLGAYLDSMYEPTAQTRYSMDREHPETALYLPAPDNHAAGPSGTAKDEGEEEAPQPNESIESPAPIRPARTLDLGLIFSAIVELEEDIKLLRECFDEAFGEVENAGTLHLE